MRRGDWKLLLAMLAAITLVALIQGGERISDGEANQRRGGVTFATHRVSLGR